MTTPLITKKKSTPLTPTSNGIIGLSQSNSAVDAWVKTTPMGATAFKY